MTNLLFLGGAASAVLYEADSGSVDGASAIDALVESADFLPAGAGGEAIFTSLYVTVTHTAAATLKVTPILDGVEQDELTIDLDAQAARTTEHFELALSVGYDRGDAVERLRAFLRGTRFAVRLKSEGGVGAGDLILDACEVEFEVVRESRTAVVQP